jgi:hypothetical protein
MPAHRAVYQPRIWDAHRPIIQAQASHHARSKPLDKHVRAGGQRQQRRPAVRIFQIDPADPLAGIDRGVKQRRAAGTARTKQPHAIAPGRLDLQHVGTEISQE